jgi:nitroreductase
MRNISNETLLHSLHWRYATKKFDPTRKLSEGDWNTLAESLRLSASSYGLQPWKFIVVQDPSIRASLQPASWGQSQVVDASHYIVFTSRTTVDTSYIESHIQNVASTRGLDPKTLDGYKNFMIQKIVHEKTPNEIIHWTQRQAYIAMGSLLQSAALLQIDACPIEGIEPAQYDKILGLQHTPYRTVATVALGYRHDKDKNQFMSKVRFPSQDVIEYR